MQRLWSRLSLLVLALFVQLGVARAARGVPPLTATSIIAPFAVTAADECVEPSSPARSVPCGEEGAPEDDSNSLEQDSPLDDVSDTECALPALLAIQLAGESPQRISAGAGMGARPVALDAPFKPPRV